MRNPLDKRENRCYNMSVTHNGGDKVSLKELSKEKKITQQEIADTIGVHQTLVSQWFTGKTKPSLDHAQMLAKLLGVSTDDVISAVRTKAAERIIDR